MADNNKYVSLVIDTYNNSEFINDAVDSALNQNYPSEYIEIIVIDDGSTDDTRKKLSHYGNKIKYLYKENGGQASALNLALRNCTGEYIVLLDSDDKCTFDRVQKVVDEFNKYDDLACVLNSRVIVNGEEVFHEKYDEFHNKGLGASTVDLFMKAGYGTSRSSFRMEYISKILPLPEINLEIEADLYFNLIMFWYGKVSCLNDQLTIYRIHGNNLFCIPDEKRLPSQIRCMEAAIGYVRDNSRKSQLYNISLLDLILKKYEIELREKKQLLKSYTGKAGRAENFLIELDKISYYKYKWNRSYLLFKLIALPLYIIFSYKFMMKYKKYYSTSPIIRYREKLIN